MEGSDEILWSEIIERQIELQHLESVHAQLVGEPADPKLVRASKRRMRAAARYLNRLKKKAGIFPGGNGVKGDRAATRIGVRRTVEGR